MDLEALFGMVFTLLFFCIIFGFVLLMRRSRMRERHMEFRRGESDAAQAALLDQLNRLEERIRVLERIVTDEKSDLRREFRDLGS